MSDLAKRLRIKAGMIEMGERIAWGSDSALMREAADALDHAAVERKKVSRPQIREVFLRNGAVIPADRDDLPDYVYESVFELLEMAAPDVQGEAVAWMTHHDEPMFFATAKEASAYCDHDESPIPLYTAPQPAEQQPAVTQLVEALADSVEYLDSNRLNQIGSGSALHRAMTAALAAYRKGVQQ